MKKLMCLCAVWVSAVSFAQNPIVMPADPHKRTCVQENVFDKNTVQLCVEKGRFSSDKYDVLINDEKILSVLDGEAARGVGGVWNGHQINLLCKPVNIPRGATEEQVLQLVPSLSKEKVKKIVDLVKENKQFNEELANILAASSKDWKKEDFVSVIESNPAAFGVEAARNCAISLPNNRVMSVQFIF